MGRHGWGYHSTAVTARMRRPATTVSWVWFGHIRAMARGLARPAVNACMPACTLAAAWRMRAPAQALAPPWVAAAVSLPPAHQIPQRLTDVPPLTSPLPPGPLFLQATLATAPPRREPRTACPARAPAAREALIAGLCAILPCQGLPRARQQLDVLLPFSGDRLTLLCPVCLILAHVAAAVRIPPSAV